MVFATEKRKGVTASKYQILTCRLWRMHCWLISSQVINDEMLVSELFWAWNIKNWFFGISWSSNVCIYIFVIAGVIMITIIIVVMWYIIYICYSNTLYMDPFVSVSDSIVLKIIVSSYSISYAIWYTYPYHAT